MKLLRVKVSVIMPAYNAASTIDDAVRSVLAQKGALFELLIGDDASKDATWERIKRYRPDLRVRAFRFRKNLGAGAASNRLIAKARGRYLSSCDADDRLLPGNLSRLAEVLDRRPSVGVTYGDVRHDSLGRSLAVRRRMIFPKNWDLLGGFLANGGTLIRKSLFHKVGGYRENLPYLEDCDLFLRLAEKTKFFYLPGKPVYWQTRRPGSLSDQPLGRLRRVSQTMLRDAIRRRYGHACRS